jgi:hypothetical protein
VGGRFSYLNVGFRPSLPTETAGIFKMADLLRWARVDPASRRQMTAPAL